MKSKLTNLLILLLTLGLMPINFSNAAGLATSLKGKILLQVESNGEAWYVNPENEKRYYLGRPADAFQVMRNLGLGISNKDFSSFNGYAPSRLSGKILIKVEDNGKAYYVNPANLKMHYLGRPADAFKIMRELGLGISNGNLLQIPTVAGETTKNKMDQKKYSPPLSYDDAYKAVVRIECSNSDGSTISYGSGVIVSPTGVVITNHHVVSGGTGKGGCIGGIITKEDSFEPDYFFNLSFVTTDVTNDNAIGRIKNNFNYEKLLYVKNVKEMDEYPYLKLNSSNKIGQTINALGYPDIANGSIVLTKGIISSKTKINDYNYILSDVNVSYGNSGGAIINDKGELLGLATSVQHSDISSLTYILQIDFIKIQKLFWDKVNPTEFLKEELDNINEVLTTNGLSS